MGLDMTEFVIAIEDRFGITISDADAVEIKTPRMLFDYICVRAGTVPSVAPCLSQQIFYRLRRVIQNRFSVVHQAIRPATGLEALIPKEARPVAWKDLQADLGLSEWPDLVRPRWLLRWLTGMTLAIGVATFVIGVGLGSFWPATWASLVAMGLMSYLLGRLTVPWQIELATPYTKVRELVRFVQARTPPPVIRSGPQWTREHVASVVHNLIVEQLGITEYTEDSRWVEDMGLE
jgi:acyl carrier protein